MAHEEPVYPAIQYLEPMNYIAVNGYRFIEHFHVCSQDVFKERLMKKGDTNSHK